MSDSTNWIAAVASVIVGLGGIWLKGRVDRAGKQEDSLTEREGKLIDRLQGNYERMVARVKTLEEDQKANYAQITLLGKKNSALEVEIAKKDEIIQELQNQVTKLKAQVARLEEQLEQMQGGK